MGKLIVELGEHLVPGIGESPFAELSNDDKDAICDGIWDELEGLGAIPGQGYGLRVTSTGFYVDGDLGRIDYQAFRDILDDGDYEYEFYQSDEARPWVVDEIPVPKEQLRRL